ncbi:MAG: ERMES complex subunit [Thelocarpon impressellum]|nr:MAG: ERMES complex subunit [Thelocarpon impressellum]
MAFNFNWSPLTADASFYSRARELLTAALNKSPKPPIIVDDILVNELNLGSVPPELEILEIGDLAEDRFRGIFKMCYSGDAFLTLKTRVQANPLNTYLSSKPSFTSPQPLAASSGLTIPLQITLSDIKLSAFIILVFSKQKGLTLVFRNDPLESLKVSSTFDSIPFVRDYLQKEIEGQLRLLLMEDVPAIIHRLSLRLWVPEYRAKEDQELAREGGNCSEGEKRSVDPLATPAQDPVARDLAAMSSLSLDAIGGAEAQSQFSEKNLLRLAALTGSQRTLSLFTPSIRDAVFRAWATSSERGDGPGANTPTTPLQAGFTRAHSYSGSTGTTYTFSDHSGGPGSFPSRPALSSFGSAASGLGTGAGRHSRALASKKKKRRVVNLRRTRSCDGESVDGDDSIPTSSSASAASGEPDTIAPIPERSGEEPVTPPRTPHAKVRYFNSPGSIDLGGSPPKLRPLTPARRAVPPGTAVHEGTQTSPEAPAPAASSSPPVTRAALQQPRPQPARQEKAWPRTLSSSSLQLQNLTAPIQGLDSTSSGGILEQAWMMKWAAEMARRAAPHGGKAGSGGIWQRDGEDRADSPPPAYEVRSP